MPSNSTSNITMPKETTRVLITRSSSQAKTSAAAMARSVATSGLAGCSATTTVARHEEKSRRLIRSGMHRSCMRSLQERQLCSFRVARLFDYSTAQHVDGSRSSAEITTGLLDQIQSAKDIALGRVF